MITAALVHAELATAEPFGSADGLVARAAERLVLVSSGVDAKSLVVPEAGHLALRPAYESNLRAYAGGGRAGIQAWLLYCTEAYAAGAEASPLRGCDPANQPGLDTGHRCERHPRGRVPPLTREPGYQACIYLVAASGGSR